MKLACPNQKSFISILEIPSVSPSESSLFGYYDMKALWYQREIQMGIQPSMCKLRTDKTKGNPPGYFQLPSSFIAMWRGANTFREEAGDIAC